VRWWRRQDETADAVLGTPADPVLGTPAKKGLVEEVQDLRSTVDDHAELWKQVGHELRRNGGPIVQDDGTVVQATTKEAVFLLVDRVNTLLAKVEGEPDA